MTIFHFALDEVKLLSCGKVSKYSELGCCPDFQDSKLTFSVRGSTKIIWLSRYILKVKFPDSSEYENKKFSNLFWVYLDSRLTEMESLEAVGLVWLGNFFSGGKYCQHQYTFWHAL